MIWGISPLEFEKLQKTPGYLRKTTHSESAEIMIDDGLK
jgi:hypothetical protein